MEYRRVGRSGLKVSVFGLGGWLTFGESVKDKKIINRIIKTAYEKGINYFDIADVYALGEAEKLMGEVLREYPRHRLVITSKVFWPMSDDINDRGLSRKHIFESIDKSLKRIGTDYIDIYYCHRFDPEVPLEETLRAMSDLVHHGKILYWGTSMWSHAQILEAMMLCERYGLYKPIVEQPVYNLIIREHFEKEVKPSIEKFGIGAIVFSPLLSGILTGKYDEGIPPGSRLGKSDVIRERHYTKENIEKVRKFKNIADRIGYSRAQVALAWLKSKPGVSSIILGATKPQQLEENLRALEIELTQDLINEIENIFV